MKYTANFKIPISEDNDSYNIAKMMEGYQILDADVPKMVSNVFKRVKNVTINASGWVANNKEYEYKILDSSITENTVANVIFTKDSLFSARFLYPISSTRVGYILLYAKQKPTSDLKCEIQLLKGV